jgi:uncharacterized protein YbbK (DUF523 family)
VIPTRRSRRRALALLDQVRDERGRRVMLVSHCLLNQNTRYAGGATRPAAVIEAVDELLGAGYGLHQLPCPEQRAWGGVLKAHSLGLHHSEGRPLFALRSVLLGAFAAWTRLSYRRLARQVVRDVIDYQRSGIDVAGIVGIGASPSCGVTTTLDLHASLDVLATCPAAALTRDLMNEQAVLGCRRPGEGMFIRALDRRLARRRVRLDAFEHDLARELRGEPQALLTSRPARTLGAPPR